MLGFANSTQPTNSRINIAQGGVKGKSQGRQSEPFSFCVFLDILGQVASWSSLLQEDKRRNELRDYKRTN